MFGVLLQPYARKGYFFLKMRNKTGIEERFSDFVKYISGNSKIKSIVKNIT